MRASCWVLSAVVMGFAATGCEGEGDAAPPDAAAPAPADAAAFREPCPSWAEDLTYGPTDGLVAKDESGELGARVIWASTVPPNVGDNTWRIRLEDADGEPLSDPAVRWVCAFSPDHVHGTAPELDTSSTPGEATISALQLWRAGGWEVRLWIDPVDSGKAAYIPVTPCGPIDEPARPHDIALRVCVPEQ